ncbi:hypothetical protein HO173_008408 [Letharia columbiana]|uniref:Transcription initiation factor TFIID subunit 2 n=1 Tax=Letharia columbiana TaxID=112416 RepID=A0A8H6L2V0_9LECA|nr:uncharacterized protein HO173_008408 [Letharia columbiana]KAF6233476.1 hypothetical protein HO173_008408 [Letharia columbiana]
MAPIVESASPQPADLGFSVSNQTVELDIDLRSRSLIGRTMITINPHSKDLRIIRLNCRQVVVTRLSLNGKPCSAISLTDPYKKAKLKWNAAGVQQYDMLQRKLEAQFKDPPEEELEVTIPKTVKIDELDPFSEEAQNILLSRTLGNNKKDSGDGSAIDLVQSSRTAIEQTARFTAISLIIDYVIENIRDGMHFVGWEEGDLRYPHAYTTNSLSPGAACCLFPCVDNLNSKCSWEISIKCQKTVGDALQPSSSSTPLQANCFHDVSDSVNETNGLRKVDVQSNFSDEDKALDLAVICTGDMTDEIVDARDPASKTTSFTCITAISAQHIGFAIGPFEHVDLAEFRESEEDERLGQNAVPVHGFCLPGRVDEIKNTCLPIAKAIDFITMTYGSYPFSDYSLCFVDDLHPDILDTGSLSICSNRLLFPEDVIEPLDRVSRQLVHALAVQWMGINIVPKDPSDFWVVVGIAYFITDIFMKKLSGNNEYRYNQKRAADRVVELDIDRPSLYDTGALIALDPSELEFLELKAPLVLFILDRRLTKAGTSGGLSRIISRIFLNAKVGDLANGSIDSPYFIRTCEKLGHMKFDVFFAQWVEGAGCPKFRVTQRFNKKKLVVEMMIQQSQAENIKDRDMDSEYFVRDVKEEHKAVYAGPIQPAFTGPMTIRIHEADGTPYEHIIEIKDSKTTFDIPYNTKYKRLKRSRRQKERTAASVGNEYMGGGNDDVLLYSLGDVLQSEEEMKEWRLAEWSKDDEEKMSQESYEWIRMDADFEWICKISTSMPPYMWVSQLQQDRDVVAQLESIQWMSFVNAHELVSTVLVRTLMDQRYFHGIRTAAAAVLAKNAKSEVGWIGSFHLEKAFQEFFCYPGSPMTRSNDFTDRASYYIQCAIPQAMAKIRNPSGHTPYQSRNFLFEKLKFNDNSNNQISDCHYVATLMRGLAEALASKPPFPANDLDDFEDNSEDNQVFLNACLEEIDRHRRIDEWIPSYHNILSTTALDCKRILAKAGIIQTRPVDFLHYTPDGTSEYLRLSAFSNVMALGFAKNHAILRWFLFVLGTDPSPYVRENLLRIFGKALGAIAVGEHLEVAKEQAAQLDGLVIEQESTTEGRQADLARKQTVEGALNALRDEVSADPVLKKELWKAIESPTLSLRQLGELLGICDWLYEPDSKIIVLLRYPRYWEIKNLGKGKLLFTRTSRVRTTIAKRKAVAALPQPFIKRENSIPNNGMQPPLKLMFKPKKPPMQSTASASSVTSVESVPPSPVVEGDNAKPKLKIKFKVGGGAGSPS